MNTMLRKRMRPFFVILMISALFLASVVPALAEYITVTLSNGAGGAAITSGSPGSCTQGGGNATSSNFTTAPSSIYYLDTWSREWSTHDYNHIINEFESYRYWNTNSGGVTVPWPDCSYIYVTARHAWIPYPGAASTVKYTSGRGTSSSATCWRGNSSCH